MNYCTNCGAKINEKDKFCTKCGTMLKKSVPKKTTEVKKEPNTEKWLLILGIFLVLFSSFALGIILWENMGNIFRLGFFVFECLLFFGLSFVLKLVKSKLSKVFFTIGLVLIPYTLCLIPYYNLTPEFYNSGPGLYVYLAIVFFITFVLYILVNLALKGKLLEYLALFSLFISFVNAGLIFSDNAVVISFAVVLYISIINFISHIDKFKFKIKKALSVTSGILLVLILPFICGTMFNYYEPYNVYLNLGIVLLYLASTYIRLAKNPKTFFVGIAPFSLPIVACTYTGRVLWNSNSFESYGIALVAIILYFITILFEKKVLRILSLIVTYITLAFLLFIAAIIKNYEVMLVISGLLLILNVSDTILFKNKFCEYMIPINLYLLILSLLGAFTNLKAVYVLVLTSLLFLAIYIILKICNKKISFTYILTALILTFFATNSLDGTLSLINLSIIGLLVFIFVLCNINKEHEALTIITYIVLNISSIRLFDFYDQGLYPGLLLISGVTLISSLIISHFKKINLKPYILYSEIVILLITLFNSMNHSNYVLFINVFIFSISYLSLIKYFNAKWYRVLYMMIGLLTVNRIIFTVIEPVVIASILSFTTILITLVIMYLLEVENNVTLVIISLILLCPYYSLLNAVGAVNELYLLPLVMYNIVLTEIIKFKSETAKKLWTIIPLSVLSYFFILMNSGIGSIVFDVILSLIFILLGLYRKYNYLIYFGIIFIIITIFIRLFTILNSMIVVVLLIIIGFILIGIVLINELRKK